MVADRFDEPGTIPFDELLETEYENYLENLKEDEEALTLEEYKEVHVW